MRIKVWASIGLVGCTKEDVIEIDKGDYNPDGSVDEDTIEEYAREWKDETVEWGWEVIDPHTTRVEK